MTQRAIIFFTCSYEDVVCNLMNEVTQLVFADSQNEDKSATYERTNYCNDTFLQQHPKQAKVSRRFLVVEGIYMNNGTLCNIDRMIDLKRKYKLRLFIDETVSFGTLGEHGRGITEYKNISVNCSERGNR